MNNLEALAIKQGKQIEALEELVRFVTNRANPTIEGFIDHWDKHNTSHSRVIVEIWEKQNAPLKWDEEL